MKETSLAWALADATKPHLNAVERSDVHVTIGVGETFAAIRYLITFAANRRIALSAPLVQQCHGWLDLHIGHEDERRLRGLVEQALTSRLDAATEPINSHRILRDKQRRCD